LYCAGFLLFVYICIAVGDPVIKRAGLEFPLTDLNLPQFCACPKPGPGFPPSYVVGLFMFNEFS
jgi:hypothetical protein